MDNRFIPQGNDPTEQRSRRRLSSILKAPRSPLRDLGIGNELHQESTIEKRRKSSRRVSFAETIRVFTPELKSAGAGEAEHGGGGATSSFRNENESIDGKCNITGMDRLLHGPLQAPAHQTEWDYTNCNKDQTIFFPSDNDMDMTASNTVAIDGLIEEKPKKIDTSSFLASLKAPTSKESSNFDFKLSTAGQKLWDFQPSTSTKFKFSDFLSGLGNESTTSPNMGVDKENYFPFASKENLYSTKAIIPSFNTPENTGNITCMFRDQDGELDLTRCNTTNITSFLPTVNHQLTNLNAGNPPTSNTSTKEFMLLEQANFVPKSVSTDQTVLCEDDMDMTFSHTTRIHGVLKENALRDKTKTFFSSSNERTIIYTDENEMELTKNDSIFFNSTSKKGRPSVQRNCTAFSGDQSTVCPEEDMDMTKSHTVAIDGPAICEMLSKGVTGNIVQSGKRQQRFGFLPFQTSSSNSENEQQVLGANRPLKAVRDLRENKPFINNTDPKSDNKNEKSQNSCSFSMNVPPPSTEKTILFACEQDDMEMTKSHTIAIDSNAFGVTSNVFIPNSVRNERRSHFKGLKLSSGFNNAIFFSSDGDDMDLTHSHTVRIDQKPLVENVTNHNSKAANLTKHFQKSMETTVVEHDGLQNKSALADNKTVVFTCEQQAMDITQSHTIAIDGDAWCEEFPPEKCIGGNEEEKNAVLLSNKESKNIAMQAFVDDRITSSNKLANPANVLCMRLGDQVYRTMHDNTAIFPSDQDDMELTRSHTTAIDSKTLPILDNTQRINSILKDKKSKGSLRLSTMHNKTVLFSTEGDDMDLTQSHTTCIDQNHLTSGKQKRLNAVNQTTLVLDDMEMTMVEAAALERDCTINESKSNKTVVFTCEQPDMDITRSHTVAIAGDALPKVLQPCTVLAINQNPDLVSTVPRFLPPNYQGLESKNMRESVDQIDRTCASTITDKRILMSGESAKTITSVPCPDKTVVFEDDMEYTKSHTAVIDGINRNELPSQTFSADNLNITKSNTVFIDRVETNKMTRNDQEHKTTSIKLSEPCNIFLDDLKTTAIHTKWNCKVKDSEKATMSVLSKDKTYSSLDQEDMDLTRANTVAIENKVFCEVEGLQASNPSKTQNNYAYDLIPSYKNIPLDNKVNHCASPAGSREADMDITKSSTVYIDHIPIRRMPAGSMIESQDVLFSQKVTGLHDKTKSFAGQTKLNNLNDSELTKIERTQEKENVCFLPKTSENRILGHREDAYTVQAENNMSDVVKSQNSDLNVFIGTSKNFLSRQKSFSIFDETVHQVCNMEETNIDLTINDDGKHPGKHFLDQTLCNQGDMEITKCHTTKIESKIKQTSSKCPEKSDAPAHKDITLLSNDMSVKLTSSLNAETLNNDQANFTGNATIHQGHTNEHLLPCTQNIEIEKAAAVKVNTTEKNCPENPNNFNLARNGSIQVLKSEKSNILSVPSQKYESSLKQSIDATQRKGLKHSDFSMSLLGKTVMFSGDLGDMEFTQIDTMTVSDISEQAKKPKSAGADKTCLFLETEMDITKSNTVYIDQGSKDIELTTLKNEIKRSSSVVSHPANNYEGTVSIPKDANTEVDLALDDKYIVPDSSELTECKAPSGDAETKTVGSHKPIYDFSPTSNLCVPSELNYKSASREQKTVAEYICSKPSEASANNPGDVQNAQVVKKNRLSKRVSFCIPEKDNRDREIDDHPNTDVTLQTGENVLTDTKKPSHCSQFTSGFQNEPTGDISAKLDLTALLGCSLEKNHLNHFGAETTVVLSPDKPGSEKANHDQQGLSIIELSQKEKNKRRSIADIQQKIRRLTEKSKNPLNNHTAPVSCPSNEVITLPQTPNPSVDCIPEQTLLNEQEPKENIQVNGTGIKGKETGTTKEMCFQNRLSVNMLQPKLPSKRHSNTCNIQESVHSTTSKPSIQTPQTSVNLLKAFTDCYEGQCIDAEMLPACPDDHDGNSLFQYEVPEGAWEELCEKEAMHKNLDNCSLSKETVNTSKRARDSEDDALFQREKRARRNDDTQNTQISVGFKSQEECSRGEYSSHHTSKTMEQTYCSSSSQDSREGMSELSSQQYSQMDSQLPWDNGCGQNLWQKFQDGTITVKEFFMLLRIRILIQKPRYSELPVNRGNYQTLSSTDLMLDLFIYQPKLQVYEEECHNLYQTTEELKLYTDMQEKPLTEVSSLLWEAMRMCSEDELMCFGMTLKNLKTMYSKKSRILAHEAKVSIYSKLLQKAQVQVVEVRTRIAETAKLLEEIDDCISNLNIETAKMEEKFQNNWVTFPAGKPIQCELENLISQEQACIRERSHLEERKEKILTQLGCLQDEARGLNQHLQEPCFAEWEMNKWTETKATFVFLYDSLELNIMFGEVIDGEKFNNQPCRRISRVILMSQLNQETAPPSSLLVHRLLLQFIEQKGNLHESYKMQKDVPQLLFDVSLVVSRCKQFGEEVEYLMRWGAKYNILKTQVESNEVKLLFSSSAANAKFELSVQISEMYPTVPLSFKLLNRIGNLEYNRVAAVISKVPLGLGLLKRTVRSLHEHLLV